MHYFDSAVIGALATAVAGVALFALSQHLPAPFPPSVTRFVGFFALLAGLFSFWVASGSWPITVLIGVLGIAVMLVVHVVEMRHAPASPAARDASTPAVTADAAREQGSSADIATTISAGEQKSEEKGRVVIDFLATADTERTRTEMTSHGIQLFSQSV